MTELAPNHDEFLVVNNSNKTAPKAAENLVFRGSYGIVNTNNLEQEMRVINELKSFEDLSQKLAKETISRFHQNVLRSVYYQEWKERLITEADKYKIPFDKADVDIISINELDDELFAYKEDLSAIRALGVDWNTSVYNPIRLKEVIRKKRMNQDQDTGASNSNKRRRIKDEACTAFIAQDAVVT